MSKPLRNILTTILGGGGLLLLQYAMAWLIPLSAVVFYVPTVVILEILENRGLPTLQGSPDGWPVPTTYGWYIAAGGWWLLWSLLLAVALWFRYRRDRASSIASKP